MDWPLRFGIFLAPFHPVGQNPTLALERDMELLVRLDELGYDEAWIGEHHSAGYEIIASPEVFIAAAAQRTRHLRLGTGVSSLPYHHPLILADRMVLLDHLTRGRTMFGVGPGALPSDAFMMRIAVDRQRWRLVGPMHLAETEERAREEVAFGLADWVDYFRRVAALPLAPETDDSSELVDALNASGFDVIGTPDMAIAQIQRLIDQSGGFGTYLFMAQEWARREPTLRSYELFAREVMPLFQGSTPSLVRSRDWAGGHRH